MGEKGKEFSSWNESSSVLLEVLEQCQPPTDNDLCHKCHQKKVVIRCIECAYKRLCYLCDNELHTLFPFHDREAYANRYMKPISPTITIDSDGKLVDVGMWLAGWQADRQTD